MEEKFMELLRESAKVQQHCTVLGTQLVYMGKEAPSEPPSSSSGPPVYPVRRRTPHCPDIHSGEFIIWHANLQRQTKWVAMQRVFYLFDRIFLLNFQFCCVILHKQN